MLLSSRLGLFIITFFALCGLGSGRYRPLVFLKERLETMVILIIKVVYFSCMLIVTLWELFRIMGL